jgi:hypothetical protein
MKFWSRAVRILLATIVATQGVAFIPAMAASQSKRLAVKAIGIEELKSEFGGFGGGGGNPTPSGCPIDFDYDGSCDMADYSNSRPFTSSEGYQKTLVSAGAWSGCANPDSANGCNVSPSVQYAFSWTHTISPSLPGTWGIVTQAVGYSGSWGGSTTNSYT